MSSSLTDGESNDVVLCNSRPALAEDYYASAGAPGTDCGSSVVKLSLVLVGLRLFRTILKYTGLHTGGGSGNLIIHLTYRWDMIRQGR